MIEERVAILLLDNFHKEELSQIVGHGNYLFNLIGRIYEITDLSPVGGEQGLEVSMEELWRAAVMLSQIARRRESEMFTAKSGYRGSDDKKVRYAKLADAKNMAQGSEQLIEDKGGNWRRVKITSIKTWKTRPDVRVRWKFGLWEYGETMFYPNSVSGPRLLMEV